MREVVFRTLTTREDVPQGIRAVSPRETGNPIYSGLLERPKMGCYPQLLWTTGRRGGAAKKPPAAMSRASDKRLHSPDGVPPGIYASSGSRAAGSRSDSPRRSAPSVASPARILRLCWTFSRVMTVDERSIITTSQDRVPSCQNRRYSWFRLSVPRDHVRTLLRGFLRCGVILGTPNRFQGRFELFQRLYRSCAVVVCQEPSRADGTVSASCVAPHQKHPLGSRVVGPVRGGPAAAFAACPFSRRRTCP